MMDFAALTPLLLLMAIVVGTHQEQGIGMHGFQVFMPF